MIIEHDLGGNYSLQKVRDIFIGSVYTGLRFQDAMNMEVEKVKKDRNGNYTFQFYQEKTGESVNVPLLPPAVAIFFVMIIWSARQAGKFFHKCLTKR